jgi:hypothetical protein
MLVITATMADARLESSHSKTASLLLEKCAQVSLELTVPQASGGQPWVGRIGAVSIIAGVVVID